MAEIIFIQYRIKKKFKTSLWLGFAAIKACKYVHIGGNNAAKQIKAYLIFWNLPNWSISSNISSNFTIVALFYKEKKRNNK